MSEKSSQVKREKFFGRALHDVEHALCMHATSFCVLPAEGIYDKKMLEHLMSVIESCHIYLIGYTPDIESVGVELVESKLNLKFNMVGSEHIVSYDVPDGVQLKEDDESPYLEDDSGRKYWPNSNETLLRLKEQSNELNFDVKYIGQAYGKNGSRNAIDRLLKHETLQKISLKGVPKGYQLTIVMLAIQPDTKLFTIMNPFAQKTEDGSQRISSGLDKLFNTTEKERVALYEASLIRYFQPSFNKEFKNSFPSTNLKILQDCYKKDFAGVVAEICFDDLPFKLFSDSAELLNYHIVRHHLHKDEERKIFFGM